MGKTGKRKDHKKELAKSLKALIEFKPEPDVPALEDITDNMPEGIKKLYNVFEDISLCPSCYSMTHTFAGKCGKCQAKK